MPESTKATGDIRSHISKNLHEFIIVEAEKNLRTQSQQIHFMLQLAMNEIKEKK